MFDNSHIDGSSSYVPGEGAEADANNEEQLGDVGVEENNINRKGANMLKRSASVNNDSPKKYRKNPMVKIIKDIIENMQSFSAVTNKVLQGEMRSESIKEVMRLTVESGAIEGSDEHFMATKLFVKAENRDVFLTLTTKEGRLNWLKRWCEEKKKE
jgi:hypothetical protein